MILLIDLINDNALMLLDSLRACGADFQAVSVMYDGFEDEDIGNPYAYYMGDKEPGLNGYPRYFDRLEVPKWWEITGTGTGADILDYTTKRARIYYNEPKHKRLVRIVDWLDEKGRVRWSDHYDRYGRHFATTTLDVNQKPVFKIYYSRLTGREVITENFVTGDISLVENSKTRYFRSRALFVHYYLQEMGFDTNRILYNSLSTPFLVLRLIRGNDGGNDILFWQEPIRDTIPGNMQQIFDRRNEGTSLVCVQSQEAYDRLLQLGAPGDRVRKLGFIYPDIDRTYDKSAIVLTNSDQVEKLEALADLIPDITIYVAAITEMSAKLMKAGEKTNIILLPNVPIPKVDELYNRCMVYLDINHQGEILSAVRKAFINRMLIFGFDTTCHNRAFTDPDNVYTTDRLSDMARRINNVVNDRELFDSCIDAQMRYGMTETVEQYNNVLTENNAEMLS